jgi:hypothetical protein
MLQQDIFHEAVSENNVELVNKLLKDKKIDPTLYGNWAIIYASSNGLLELSKLLLKDKRVDPTNDDNRAIIMSYNEKRFDIIPLLWNDKRVQQTLIKDNLKLYNKLREQYLIDKINDF